MVSTPIRAARLALRVFWAMEEKNLALIAAGIAFYGLFAIFPALAGLIAVFGLVADPAGVASLLDSIGTVVPEGAHALLVSHVGDLLAARSETLGWTTLVAVIIAIWSARAGVAAMMRALSAIAECPKRRGLRHILVAILLTLSLMGVAMLAMAVVVISPIILVLVPDAVAFGWLLGPLRWALVLGVLFAALSILYRFAPNLRGRRPAWVTPGAVLVLLLWLAASWGFSFYLANFGLYNEIYGSIGAVIALLMWFFLSAWLILLGAALNHEIALTRSE